MSAPAKELERDTLALISRELGVDEDCLPPDARLDNLGADSLDMIELAMAVEAHFGVYVHDDEIQEMRTVGDVLRLVTKKVRP